MERYEIIIYWSDDDNAYIAEVPELPGCMAHGKSYELALRNAKEAIQLWIKTAEEFNDFIPEPKGRRLVYA
ncbi:MAG: type II toxin-antitoxin system HicB family antitoxin [Thermodesulfobacteriota bacterium]